MDDRAKFARVAAADANGAARTRVRFSNWLQRHFRLSKQQHSDMVLAVNEALANAAEFAYINTPECGTITCTATYDDDTQTLDVTVTDGGRWREVAREPSTAAAPFTIRGNGIRLMRRLADELEINTSEQGTQVCLRWTHLMTPFREAASG